MFVRGCEGLKQTKMTSEGFVKARSDNLPKVDAFMLSSFFASSMDYHSAEIRGAKAARSERETYGDSAVGYVQVQRTDNICVVKGRITPEHNVSKKCYSVTATCDEAQEKVLSVQCEDCAAHRGGCKHAVAFLAWIHRRSEEPPSTSTTCYWKKSKLSTVGTDLKFIRAKDLCGSSTPKPVPKPNTPSFLSVVLNHARLVNDMDSLLTKCYKEPSNVEKLSIHYLIHHMPGNGKPANADEFIDHCKLVMDDASCAEAAKATLDQSSCPLWYELRYARITASKAYDAAHCKLLNGTLTESIMGASKLKDTEAMKRGRILEKDDIKEVEKKIKIKQCGVKLNPQYPILAASPDGESHEYCVEVKCPTTKKSMRNYITQKNEITSKHMVQVQLCMHFSNKKKALFCVAHSDFEMSRNVNILNIDYDKQFCESVIEKCISFWSNAIFPMLTK